MYMINLPTLRMRSWLFAPGDSDKKMNKAADGEADIVILDLEDAVVESGKADARNAIAELLRSKDEAQRARLWVRGGRGRSRDRQGRVTRLCRGR